MSRYVDPTEQLVTEIAVRNIKRSVEFYRSLGFELRLDKGAFVELTWEDHYLYLAELSAFRDVDGHADLGPPPQFPPGNIRVMVPNVDDQWRVANEIGARVVRPIANRSYGLRDFIITDPDGFGVRFASNLDQT